MVIAIRRFSACAAGFRVRASGCVMMQDSTRTLICQLNAGRVNNTEK
jgi:hypothetical protein